MDAIAIIPINKVGYDELARYELYMKDFDPKTRRAGAYFVLNREGRKIEQWEVYNGGPFSEAYEIIPIA